MGEARVSQVDRFRAAIARRVGLPTLLALALLAAALAGAVWNYIALERDRGRKYSQMVALEGLRLAQADIAHGTLASERQETMRRSLRDLVIALSAGDSATPVRRGLVGAEAAAPSRWRGRTVRLHRSPVEPETSMRIGSAKQRSFVWPIKGCSMKALPSCWVSFSTNTVFRTQVIGPEVIASDDPLLPANFLGAAMVCCSYLDALSTVHIRYAARRLRRKVPGARIMVGLWRQCDPATLEGLCRATSADVLVTSLHEALAGAIELSSKPKATGIPRVTAPLRAET